MIRQAAIEVIQRLGTKINRERRRKEFHLSNTSTRHSRRTDTNRTDHKTSGPFGRHRNEEGCRSRLHHSTW